MNEPPVPDGKTSNTYAPGMRVWQSEDHPNSPGQRWGTVQSTVRMPDGERMLVMDFTGEGDSLMLPADIFTPGSV
jgi:hypothetical protein